MGGSNCFANNAPSNGCVMSVVNTSSITGGDYLLTTGLGLSSIAE